MPYINIHEYDNTITGPKSYTGNVVAVPINAKDGPSDRWITVNTYDEFVQLFGPKPASVSVFGNSWEYAANLLMRNMSVCVRRITHVLAEDGSNTPTPLEGLSTAKGILKVRDIVGNKAMKPGSLIEEVVSVRDVADHSLLTRSNAGDSEANPLYKEFTNTAGLPQIFPSIYDLENATEINKEYMFELNAFADVVDDGSSYPYTATNNEWNCIGELPNPHYRYELAENEITPLESILTNNPEGVKGDFYLTLDNNPIDESNSLCRVDYVSSYPNPNWIRDQKLTPDVLLYINPDNISAGNFADVTYDATNTTALSHVWEYTNCRFFSSHEDFEKKVKAQSSLSDEQKEALINPISIGDKIYITDTRTLHEVIDSANALTLGDEITRMVDNEEELKELPEEITKAYVIDSRSCWKLTEGNWVNTKGDEDGVNSLLTFVKNHYYVAGKFRTEKSLKTTGITTNYFAEVESTNTIWEYDGTVWRNTGANVSELEKIIELSYEDTTNRSIRKYGKLVAISWIDTGSSLNTGKYRHLYNWKKADGEDRNRYFTKIHWVNSNNPIGTRPHEIIRNANIVINDININATADINRTGIDINVNKWSDIEIEDDYKENRLVSGKVGFTNNSYEPLKIYSLRIVQKSENGELSLVYNSGLEKISSAADSITEDPLVQIITADNRILGTSSLRPKLDLTTAEDRWYFELEPGATLFYNRNLTGFQMVTGLAIFNHGDVVYHLFNSANGAYDVCLSTFENLEVIKHALPENSIKEDVDNLPISDGRGNFNLFTLEYINPGTNGNGLRSFIKTIANQGIYVYIYRGLQYLERIELVSFRKRLDNGRVKIYDLDLNKDDIWRNILLKFGILLGVNDKTELPTPLYGKYIKINLNPNIIYENSYDYIDCLYGQVGKQEATLSGGGDPNDEHVKHEIAHCYKPLEDKYRYDIKFVSNGGYIDNLVLSSDITKFNATDKDIRLIEDAMLDLASYRKDCVAYLDAPFDTTLENVPFYFEHISTSYAAAYDPWCQIVLSTGGVKWMPPSFVQLYTHAKSILNGNKLYLPPAGVRRALVPEILKTNHDLPSSYITDWQNSDSAQFINPIIWINGYDYSIYGQKTLYNLVNQSDKYESALQNLNVRLVANEIKRVIFKTCIDLTFELNNMMTWNEFKSKLEPTLSVMQGEGVITTYEILMGTETMTSADLNSGHIVGTVRVAIVSAATDWDINFEIQPNDITFYENDYNSRYTE